MLSILQPAAKERCSRGGPKLKCCLEDQLLMTLEYLREYRTFFHLGKSYEMSESNCYKICCRIESELISHPHFHLPGKKDLLEKKGEEEVILIDVTESPVERPKKKRDKE